MYLKAIVALLVSFPLLAEAQTIRCPNCYVAKAVVAVPDTLVVQKKVQVTEYVPVVTEKTVDVLYAPVATPVVVASPQAIDIACLSRAVSTFATCRANGGRWLQCGAEGFAEYVNCSGMGGVRGRYRRARRQARGTVYFVN